MVEGGSLRLIDGRLSSVFALANASLTENAPIHTMVQHALTDELLDYDEVYHGKSDWKLLPSADHPADHMHCIVSGTGLTHKASAANRQKMHASTDGAGTLTDSMRMYLWGEEGGKPKAGDIGVQPEWFYKGNGSILRAHGQSLTTPQFADDGGEEPEVAGIYIVSQQGVPYRIGFTTGNEFSDHVMEKKNYLYLAPSKLRECAIGPELVLDEPFQQLSGRVTISREGKTLWEKAVNSGEQNMAHSLSNLEHHHFKYPQHCLPGQVHIHFFGADAFSFGEQIALQHGDSMSVGFEQMGRPLINTLNVSQDNNHLFAVQALT